MIIFNENMYPRRVIGSLDRDLLGWYTILFIKNIEDDKFEENTDNENIIISK